ncbi:MAG: sigma-70 family RNA polymerase sigma factor [Bacilli bacterium]|nr:sigma-70 family RNA polymerase sigma factor [Bacilli bacterium]
MDYKNINDFEVLYLIEENQSDLKNLIFDKYKPILKSISYSYFSKLKDYGVEYDDVYQEALIGLNYAIDHFSDKKNSIFYTYAVLCIKSKLSSFLNKQTNIHNRILNESMSLFSCEEFDLENIGSVNFDNNYISFYDRIIRFKNSLNNVQGQIFELKYNGFSNKDISILLDMTVKNVYYYLCSIRNKLVISGFQL